MKRLLPVAAAALLLIVALHKPSAPQLSPAPDVQQLIELVRANPELWRLILLFAQELGINLVIKPPPKPIPTNITLTTEPDRVTAGGEVAISGVLTTPRGPLAGQLVAIYLDGALTQFATTDSQGRFKTVATIHIYKPRVEIRAVYKPLPGEPYLESNATAAVEVLYNTTTLHISAPRRVKWGEELTLHIRQDPPIRRTIRIAAGGRTYSLIIYDESTVRIPTAALPPGTLHITARAEGKGPYAPAAATATVEIEAETPRVTLETPPLLFAGLPAEIRYSTTPNISTALLLAGRPYRGYVPLDLATGFYDLTLKTAPAPPYRAVSATQRVLVINFTNLAPLPAAVAVAYVVYRRHKTKREEVEKIYEEVKSATPQSRVFSLEAEEALRLLAHAYYTLGERSGVRYNRRYTYREYASAVANYARSQDCLWHLVALAERAVYSPLVPTPVELARGWQCLEQL